MQDPNAIEELPQKDGLVGGIVEGDVFSIAG